MSKIAELNIAEQSIEIASISRKGAAVALDNGTDIKLAFHRTREFLDDKTWIKHNEAVDDHSNPVDLMSDAATGFCLQGALLRANLELVGHDYVSALRILNRRVASDPSFPGSDIFAFNDHSQTEYTDVCQLLQSVADGFED